MLLRSYLVVFIVLGQEMSSRMMSDTKTFLHVSCNIDGTVSVLPTQRIPSNQSSQSKPLLIVAKATKKKCALHLP